MASKYQRISQEAVAEKIECYILANHLTAHQKLPSERKMSEMWKVNRTTLRNAVNQLIAEGQLYKNFDKSLCISPPKFMQNLQYATGFTEAARLAGQNPSARVISVEVCDATKKVAQELKLLLGHKIMKLVRVMMLDGTPVQIDTAYLDAERFAEIEKQDYSKMSLYEVLEGKYGVSVTHGSEELSITYIDSQEAALLEMPENTPVIYQKGVVIDQNDVPVEYFKSLIRSEYVRFVSKLVG